MDLTEYLNKIIDLVDEINKKGNHNFYLQMKNVLRIYYLGINNILVTKRVLKNISFDELDLSSRERDHIKNVGWLLDDNYVSETYLGVLKMNLILDSWVVLKSNKDLGKSNDLYENYGILIDSLYNSSEGTKTVDINLEGKRKIEIKKNEKIDISLEKVLELVKKIVGEFNMDKKES